jgi:hypothetical protein
LVHAWDKKQKPGSTERVPTWTAIDWEPVELSAFPIGADAGAGIGRAAMRKPMHSAATTQRSGADEYAELEAMKLRIELMGLEI